MLMGQGRSITLHRAHTHVCTGACVHGECSGQCPDMLDSWEICQPSAWAFQTMPHNVLDSPEKQPGAWKLPAHHLNSLIWALSGFLSLSLSLQLSICGITPSLQFSFFSSFTLPALIFFLINTLCDTAPPSTYSFYSFPILEHMTTNMFLTLFHKKSLPHSRLLAPYSFLSATPSCKIV